MRSGQLHVNKKDGPFLQDEVAPDLVAQLGRYRVQARSKPPFPTLTRCRCAVHNLYNCTGKTCPTPNLDPQNGLQGDKPHRILPKELQNWGVGGWETYPGGPIYTYQGSKKAAATLTPAATATTYVTIRLLSMRATKMRNGTADWGSGHRNTSQLGSSHQ